ncbi:MAG: hypothetical protein ACK41P_02530 [Asticcacaulis sp.]
MSCAVLSAMMLFMTPVGAEAAAPTHPVAVSALSREPLYADIVRRARGLHSQVQLWQRQGQVPAANMAQFERDLVVLAERDMKAHHDLAKRGTDSDLKCILKGISEDLQVKLAALQQAKDDTTRRTALEDMGYLLNDNVEVITTPPTVQSGKEG